MRQPANLNILVPCSNVGALQSFLVRLGFASQETERHREPYTGPCKKISVYVCAGTKKRIEVAAITRAPILHGLLAASGTAAMNALTGTSIYSFYGDLTMRGISIGTPSTLAIPKEFFEERNLTYYSVAGDMQQPCGLACPGILRRVRGSRGIAIFEWDDAGPNQPLFEDDSLEWRIGHVCRNPLCTYFGK